MRRNRVFKRAGVWPGLCPVDSGSRLFGHPLQSPVCCDSRPQPPWVLRVPHQLPCSPHLVLTDVGHTALMLRKVKCYVTCYG